MIITLWLQNHYDDAAMCCWCAESNTMNATTLYIYATGSVKCDFSNCKWCFFGMCWKIISQEHSSTYAVPTQKCRYCCTCMVLPTTVHFHVGTAVHTRTGPLVFCVENALYKCFTTYIDTYMYDVLGLMVNCRVY